MKTPSETNKGPVAVIAVHGVADQKKDETAQHAVDLLLNLDEIEKGSSKEPFYISYISNL